MWYEKLATIVLWVYIIWMIPSGRTTWYCRRDHPKHTGLTSTRPVLRDEEPGTYWGVVAFHVVLVSAMTYIAFFK